MTGYAWALIGAFVFVLAYTYYTIAGLYYIPGGDVGIWLIEFGSAIGLMLLAATVAGACVIPPPAQRGPQGESQTPEKQDE